MKRIAAVLGVFLILAVSGCIQIREKTKQTGTHFIDFFVKSRQAGGVVMWAGDWNELAEESGPSVLLELASDYGFTPVVEVTVQSGGQLIRPLSEATKQSYRNSALWFAEKYRPKYLGLGIEINSLYEGSPEDFNEFVSFYNGLFDEIKARSPSTKVFTVFQLEKMKGLALWSAESADPDKAQWLLIDRLKSDIAAFTTYPSLVYKDPSEMPPDYYNEIKSRTSKPIAFTEMGWHSAADPAGWESSESEQAEFIKTFFNLTKDLDIEMVVWSFMYDPDSVEPFNSMGLRRSDGTARPAWDAWLEAA